jgi:hypothetical protein
MPCKELRPQPVAMTVREAEAELEIAARSLETRAQLLRVQTRKITEEEWHRLRPQLREFVPHWYCGLLSRFSLYGVTLEYRDKLNPGVCCFSFAGPEDYNTITAPGTAYSSLLTFGIFPLGSESNGNLWVAEPPVTAASVAHLLELSDWGGGKPARRNGLRFGASRLSLLLSTMGVSEVSYYDSPAGVSSLIWYEDRESPPDD